MNVEPSHRRDFLRASAAIAAAGLAAHAFPSGAFARIGASRLRIGVIGCGGRGTGAAVDALNASPDTEIVALADVMQDRLAGCRNSLASDGNPHAARAKVPEERCFGGFEGYKQLLDSGVDCVILATPPHFRPMHFAAAVERSKHVFMEKPVAVDPVGVRAVLAAAEVAERKRLNVVAGTQRRHEQCYLEAMARIRDGAIGRITSARVYWNQGGLWMHKRRPEWSDMEWQLRNWLYFAWLSGDHIVEQHVHNLDVACWALEELPRNVSGMGGRQVRTSPDYGHVFDHFAVDYEYESGVSVTSFCRQIDGCAGRVEEVIHGTEGRAVLSSGRAQIFGKSPWRFSGRQESPYVVEHRNLIAGITGAGPYINEGRQVALSTMLAVAGRMSAYTGKSLTWEQALTSTLDLSPPAYEMGELPTPEVAVPGRTLLL